MLKLKPFPKKQDIVLQHPYPKVMIIINNRGKKKKIQKKKNQTFGTDPSLDFGSLGVVS